MTDSVQEQLLGHLLGALDNAEHEAVDSRLKSDPRFRQQRELLQQRLQPLQSGHRGVDPPAGLARQTCRFVFSQLKNPAAEPPRRAMTPESAPPSWISRVHWIDVAMAVGIFAAAGLLLLPAIQNSRFNARVITCQDNLRQVGRALTRYSENHQGYFPAVPSRGKLAAAGIYAPTLVDEGLLGDAKLVVCPASPLAGRGEFRVPSLMQLRGSTGESVDRMRDLMGGSYGYSLGYMRDGIHYGTKNLRRTHFALMADAPSSDLPDHQTVNHGGYGQNVLFEDGHVVFMATPKPADYGDDFFANDDGLVAAGTHLDDSVIGSSTAAPIIYANRHK